VHPTIALEELLETSVDPPSVSGLPTSNAPRAVVLGIGTSVVATAISLIVASGVMSQIGPPAAAVTHHREVGSGPYAFADIDPASGTPITFPCRPIQVEVSPTYAPEGFEEMVTTAIEHAGSASGLPFDYLGVTGDRDFDARLRATTPQPVLVGWAPPHELPSLTGDVAGVGGSTPSPASSCWTAPSSKGWPTTRLVTSPRRRSSTTSSPTCWGSATSPTRHHSCRRGTPGSPDTVPVTAAASPNSAGMPAAESPRL
jgi:hypothetical protein